MAKTQIAEFHQLAQPWGFSGWHLTLHNWKLLRSNVGRKFLKQVQIKIRGISTNLKETQLSEEFPLWD